MPFHVFYRLLSPFQGLKVILLRYPGRLPWANILRPFRANKEKNPPILHRGLVDGFLPSQKPCGSKPHPTEEPPDPRPRLRGDMPMRGHVLHRGLFKSGCRNSSGGLRYATRLCDLSAPSGLIKKWCDFIGTLLNLPSARRVNGGHGPPY